MAGQADERSPDQPEGSERPAEGGEQREPTRSTDEVDDGGLTDEDIELFEDDPTIPTE